MRFLIGRQKSIVIFNAMGFLKDRRNAFYFAFKGLGEVFTRETHMKIHGLSAVVTVSAGFFFGITKYEWLMVAACIILVFSAEIINTALEKICDVITPGLDERIRYIKDISAAFVLLICLLAAICGTLIFWPYVKNWIA